MTQHPPPPRVGRRPSESETSAPAKPAMKEGGLHKVIMVGGGGVGKSALTLQFMYNEVRARAVGAVGGGPMGPALPR